MKVTEDFFGFQHKNEDPEEEPEIETTEETTEEEVPETEEEEEEVSSEDQQEEQEEEETPEIEEFSFKPVWDELIEDGVLFHDEGKEYEDSTEGYKELQKDTIKKMFDDEWSTVPEEYRSIKEHLASGKTLQEWVDRMDPTDFANADLEDEPTQEILVREQYKAQGFSEKQMDKKVAKLKEQGLLDSEAEDAQEFLVEKQAKDRATYEQQLIKENEQLAQQRANADKQLLDDINGLSELESISLTPEVKSKLHKHLTEKGKDGLTPFQRNLSNKEGLLAAALKDMLGIGKEYVERKAVTKATSNLKKELQKKAPRATSAGKPVTTTITTKGIPTKGMPWG